MPKKAKAKSSDSKSKLIKYARHYLQDVVLRIDFPASYFSPPDQLPRSLARLASRSFPLVETQTKEATEVEFSEGKVSTRTQSAPLFLFRSADRSRFVRFETQSFLHSDKKYESFETLMSSVEPLLDEILQLDDSVIANRIGLRYVNVITAGKASEPLQWDGFIAADLIPPLNFGYEGSLCRAIGLFEYKLERSLIRLQSGFANPDHPAPIRQRQFILDIDAFTFEALAITEVKQEIASLHEKVQHIFESAIDEKLRKAMGRV